MAETVTGSFQKRHTEEQLAEDIYSDFEVEQWAGHHVTSEALVPLPILT